VETWTFSHPTSPLDLSRDPSSNLDTPYSRIRLTSLLQTCLSRLPIVLRRKPTLQATHDDNSEVTGAHSPARYTPTPHAPLPRRAGVGGEGANQAITVQGSVDYESARDVPFPLKMHSRRRYSGCERRRSRNLLSRRRYEYSGRTGNVSLNSWT
jgi:hypothetical protein